MITNVDFLIQILVGVLVGGFSGHLGSLMLSKKMTLIVDPLSHLALPGVALALVFNKDISLGAFLFLFCGTILIWFLEKKTQLPTENIIAILFSASLSLTFLFLPEEKLEKALLGNILEIGLKEGIIIIIFCFLAFFLIQKIYSQLILITLSEDLARSQKINIEKIQILYLFSISLLVALAVKFVGGLLVAALTAIPSASAKNLSHNLKYFRWLSVAFGTIAALGGILIYKITGLPAGPLIVLMSFLIFLLSINLRLVLSKTKF